MDNITLWMFFLLALVSSHKADELSNIQDNVITDYSQDIGSSLQGELPFNQEVNVYLPGPQTKRFVFFFVLKMKNVSNIYQSLRCYNLNPKNSLILCDICFFVSETSSSVNWVNSKFEILAVFCGYWVEEWEKILPSEKTAFLTN